MWMCSLCRLLAAKNHNFGKFRVWGLLYRPPFTDEGQIWCAIADWRSMLTCQISSRSVYSLTLCRRKMPIFAVFWTSAFSGLANWQQSEKVEHGRTTTNIPLSNVIKIVSALQRLHGEIGPTSSDVQKRDGQTDKQTKNSTFLAAPAAGEIGAPPNLAWWQRTRRTFLHLQNFCGLTHSFAARGCWKFGANQTMST